MSQNSKERDAVEAVVNQWMNSLDNNDLEGLLATCAEDVIVANENQPTTMGIDLVREQYVPRMEMANFKSEFKLDKIIVDEHFAVVVGTYEVEITDKASQESQMAKGRVALVYRKETDGSWKLVLDVDNN